MSVLVGGTHFSETLVKNLFLKRLKYEEHNKRYAKHVLAVTNVVNDMGPELPTGRMDPQVGSGSGWVGLGRVGSGHDFAGIWRVGLGQHFGFFSFSLIISWCLNRYESWNTTFGLIDLL